MATPTNVEDICLKNCMLISIFFEDKKSGWKIVGCKDGAGTKFTATGNNLPVNDGLKYDLFGFWEKNPKNPKKWQFKTTSAQIVLPNTQKEFVNYISSLQIGVGKLRATAIFKKFGE